MPDRGIVIDKKNANHANPSPWAYIGCELQSRLLPCAVTSGFVRLITVRAPTSFCLPCRLSGPLGALRDVLIFALFSCTYSA